MAKERGNDRGVGRERWGEILGGRGDKGQDVVVGIFVSLVAECVWVPSQPSTHLELPITVCYDEPVVAVAHQVASVYAGCVCRDPCDWIIPCVQPKLLVDHWRCWIMAAVSIRSIRSSTLHEIATP